MSAPFMLKDLQFYPPKLLHYKFIIMKVVLTTKIP